MHLRPRPSTTPHRSFARWRACRTVTGAACAFLLCACTAHMDMEISPQGTYDVVMEIRDTTGSVLTADTDCSQLADPALVGAVEGATVTSSAIGSADDEDGTGCRVSVSGIAVPRAQDLGPAGSALVVREGDLDVVDLSALTATAGLSGASAEAPSAAATDAADTAAGPTAKGTATATPDALSAVVDARVSITFPGAVVQDGGGTVSGRTVTWTDTDQILAGVSASGYATQDQGLSFWDRWGWWLVGAVAGLGVLAGGATVLRRR